MSLGLKILLPIHEATVSKLPSHSPLQVDGLLQFGLEFMAELHRLSYHRCPSCWKLEIYQGLTRSDDRPVF
jgi:hypothetical protein